VVDKENASARIKSVVARMRSGKALSAIRPASFEKELLEALSGIRWELRQQKRLQESLLTATTSELIYEIQTFAEERRLGFMETLDRIEAEHLNLARYGDGEMRLMLRLDYDLGFQKNSPALGAALRALFTDEKYREKVLLGFPYVYRGQYWAGVWADLWPEFKGLASQIPQYGITHVSRPVFFETTGDAGVQAWRRLWDGKTACIITGKNSRFDLVPQLFDNLKDVRFIRSLPTNAFVDLPRVRAEIRKAPDADIYLLALGPSGTLLAADLALEGRWALDIGHISDSYKVAFEGGKWPERTPFTR
jgi:hypothetical protein